MIVTRPEQARALQDSGFLGRFLEPASPSVVARHLGISASLAHHHAKRHASLGLLNEVKREQGKVYYQLAARTFKHPRSLTPAGDPDEYTVVSLGLLRERFLQAYERSDRIEGGESPNWHVYRFDRKGMPEEAQSKRSAAAVEDRPAHFQARTLRLSGRRYRQLVRYIARLIMCRPLPLRRAARDPAREGAVSSAGKGRGSRRLARSRVLRDARQLRHLRQGT